MINDNITNYLPQDYGLVVCNFREKPTAKYGLVIPTYSRPKYVLDCFNSLQECDLKDCIVCIIDETNSKVSLPLENWYEFINIDSPGYDIKNIPGSINEVARGGAKESKCIAFNSSGWLKYRLVPLSKMQQWANTNLKLYVKKNYLDNNRELYTKLRLLESEVARHKPDSRTEEIVRAFNIADVPIIKIFKHYHRNMYDSLRQGWDLLFKVFECTYLVNLDSDALIKYNWLEQLDQTFKMASKRKRTCLVTGFNTQNHKTLSDQGLFYIKQSCGGINLFFHQKIYQPIIRPALHSIGWDHTVVENVRKHRGLIICTRPSVVQHIGKEGMWSDGTQMDTASDF